MFHKQTDFHAQTLLSREEAYLLMIQSGIGNVGLPEHLPFEFVVHVGVIYGDGAEQVYPCYEVRIAVECEIAAVSREKVTVHKWNIVLGIEHDDRIGAEHRIRCVVERQITGLDALIPR